MHLASIFGADDLRTRLQRSCPFPSELLQLLQTILHLQLTEGGVHVIKLGAYATCRQQQRRRQKPVQSAAGRTMQPVLFP